VRLTQAAVDAGRQAQSSTVRLTQIAVDVAVVERSGFPFPFSPVWLTAPVRRFR